MKPKVHSSSYIHENPWYKIRHDVLTWPNGKPGEYFVLEVLGAVTIVCVNDGQVLTTQQHRHTIDTTSVELPKGGVKKDEDSLTAAKRELREETGYEAAKWEALGTYFSQNGSAHMPMHIFIAGDLTTKSQELDDSEEGSLTTRWIPLHEWQTMITRGEITDMESLAAWALYLVRQSK